MKLSEFQGFTLDCAHILELLPVVDFNYVFRCQSCGGIQPIRWSAKTAPMNLEQLNRLAHDMIDVAGTVDLPEGIRDL